MVNATTISEGINNDSVAKPRPKDPIKLKKYNGFRDMEYGPSVINWSVLYPAI